MIEILSPSTEPRDRHDKLLFAHRPRLDYWIISPGADGHFTVETMPYGGGVIAVPSDR